MGRTRTSPPETQQAQEPHAEQAALIGAVLAGTLVVPNPAEAVAAILLSVAPAALLTAPAAAASVAFGVASLIVQTPRNSGVRGSRLTARGAGPASEGQLLREAAYKGFYALNALRRVAAAEDKAQQLRRERRFFGQQLEASRRRTAGAALNDAAAAIHGSVLSWVHTGRAKTHRPEHEAAHGANFRVDAPPASTGGLPATLPGCDCIPGPPIPGARMLV